MKKNVYLVQPNFKSTIEGQSSYWLPYSVGVLWSYSQQYQEIRDHYELKQFIFKRDNIQSVVNTLQDQLVMVLSCYVWNWEYNKALGQLVKEKFPDSFIIVGGPQITNRPLETDFFKQNPWVNVVINGEGEQGFTDCLIDHSLGRAKRIYKSSRLEKLDFPSPYLTGLFDELVRQNPDVKWNATIETNRGCPYACTFCDWGSLTYSKVKKFDIDRVYQELDWIGKEKIDYLAFADANFGAFKQRDLGIAQHLSDIRTRTGFPKNINLAYNKNSNETVVDIIDLFSKSGLNRGLTLSFQSLNDTTLEHIKRKNMAINQAHEIFDLLEKKQLNYYSELILGLPMETPESWKQGHWKLLDMGQHQTLEIFLTMMLENSELNDPEYKRKYQIQTTKVSDFFYTNFDIEDNISESLHLVKSTNTMTNQELIDCFMFSWVIINLHSYGWTQIYARFLNSHMQISYEQFYSKIYTSIVDRQLGVISELYHTYKENLYQYLNDYETFSSRQLSPDILRNAQRLLHVNRTTILNQLTQYINTNYVDLDSALTDRLHDYQSHYIASHETQYPYNAVLDLGIQTSIIQKKPYAKNLTTVSIDTLGKHHGQQDFLTKLLTWRRSNWGKTLIKDC